MKRRSDGEATRKKVLATALALFRKRGFEATTMRDIASAAGLSLGAAYHYFPSKDDLVLAWYDQIQATTVTKARARLGSASGAPARIKALIHGRLDSWGRDRKLMGALFRSVADPTSPGSVFGPRTAYLRASSVAEMAEATAGEPLPADLHELVPTVLWALHMALLLYFVHDRSPRQEKTRRLVDSTVDLVWNLVRVASTPGLEAVRGQLVAVARDAGLVITAAASAAAP
jgi:AcrR family transcriptional regulator